MYNEEIIIQIIVNGGTARSCAMEAIHLAKAGNIEGAKEMMVNAVDALGKAHKIQTELIQEEAAGNPKQVSLLMVHAQDHLMNAITIKDLAQEFIDMYEKLFQEKN